MTRRRTLFAAAAALALFGAGCTSHGASPAPPGSTTSAPLAGTTTQRSTVTTVPTTVTLSGTPTTVVTTPTAATLIAPPSPTPMPEPVTGDCPYLTNAQVEDANGQHTGKTTVYILKPYDICVFTRSSGGFLAATQIVVADTAAQAAAAVNEHVPIGESYPVTHPAGWAGGAMSTPNGLPNYPDAGSIYAVSKGPIAIIAISNQKQSIKGRQMVSDIVANLGL